MSETMKHITIMTMLIENIGKMDTEGDKTDIIDALKAGRDALCDRLGNEVNEFVERAMSDEWEELRKEQNRE